MRPPKWDLAYKFQLVWQAGVTCSGVFPGGSEVKASARSARDLGSIPGVGTVPWRRNWQPTPGFLPGESHGRRSLVGYSPRGGKESDTTERIPFFLMYLSQKLRITESETCCREEGGGPLCNTFACSWSWAGRLFENPCRQSPWPELHLHHRLSEGVRHPPESRCVPPWGFPSPVLSLASSEIVAFFLCPCSGLTQWWARDDASVHIYGVTENEQMRNIYII